MRYRRLALMLALMPSTASAQTAAIALPEPQFVLSSQVSPDIVVTRLMSFDRNQDGRVSSDELSERMRAVVARADGNGDGALDAAEVRAVAAAPGTRKVGLGGNYGFGDIGAVPMRTRIANAIEDLRLPAAVSEQARQIGETYASEVEAASLAKLREVVAPMLTEAQLAEFEASAKAPGAGGGVIRSIQNGPTVQETVVFSSLPMMRLSRLQLSVEQQRIAMTALSAFHADRQLDDVRRSALMTRYEGVLSDGEREDLQAALARRPLVKNAPVREVAVRSQSVENLRIVR
jgi:hypothetical protein